MFQVRMRILPDSGGPHLGQKRVKRNVFTIFHSRSRDWFLLRLKKNDSCHSPKLHNNPFQKAIRKGLHSLDPDYISVIAELRFIHKIALGNCAAVFACVCNGWFNQKYKLGNYILES